MTPQEYNDFLKTRRTSKVFTDEKLTAEQRRLIIDAVNYAPAQNSNRNFIPILVEKQEHKEWLQDNIFFMVSKYSESLGRVMPKEYQLGILTAPAVIIYLEASRTLPIVNHPSHLDADGSYLKEPAAGDIDIRNINIGMNMAFLAQQAYLLGLDVGFNGCTRGVRNVMETPELKAHLYSIYNEYGITDDMAHKHWLSPGYAVCIGKALPVANPMTRVTKEDLEGLPYKDGYYTNIKKHKLNTIENIRTIDE
jgi:nitroreductase